MTDLNSEIVSIQQGLQSLQNLQEKLDTETWQIGDPSLAKLRHISLHLSMAVGAIATICEAWDHAAKSKETEANSIQQMQVRSLNGILNDLVASAAQIANLSHASLSHSFFENAALSIQRFAPNSSDGKRILAALQASQGSENPQKTANK